MPHEKDYLDRVNYEVFYIHYQVFMFFFNENNFNKIKLFLTLSKILSTLLLRSGLAPVNFWFPNLMKGLTWINSLVLITWQKDTQAHQIIKHKQTKFTK